MPLVLRLLQVIGVWDDHQYRYKYILVFVAYCFGIVIPKVCFGFPTLEASIRGYAELILETNVFAGMLMFYLRYEYFEQFVVELRSFVSKAYCIAPLWSNYSGYMTAMADGNNGTTFEFSLYLEQDFYWLNTRTSVLGYSICTVFMFPLMYLCAYTGTVKTVTVFNTIKYCQSVLRIVVMKLEYMKTFPDVRHQSDALSEVRELHQRALRCAELLELVLQPLLLMQFVLCILIWGTMMLYFSVSGINVKFINMFLLFLFVSIETFGYCYLGTQLSQESINVGQALYDCNWSDFDRERKKNIAFMILRTQCQVGLTAAKFRLVNMEQFGAMLNMSYSFFVVLKDVF
ncbi:odorant receptor 33b-like [Anopheles marshallii]|uniref:odorant receptor 33b-like n=1 Tax=Anopheles marshallii TaxID=1521116 RepID=UPI00237BC6BC|nr:odorant receptor 33b-like [Anopheles marshallii]XP_053667122.1 odorant receptor 33b-like [Anopheles marshallii]